jgi:hypothetical protein
MMARMVIASTQSRSSSDSTDAMTRISTSGLENWRHSRRATLVWPLSATALGPACARHACACCVLKPLGELCSASSSAVLSWLHQAACCALGMDAVSAA